MNQKGVLTIREAGKMSFNDTIMDGAGRRNAKKLLKDLSIEFAKRSRVFFDASGDLPYIYREMQLHSILVPILWDTNDLVMTELPVDRLSDIDKDKQYGWVDYLVKKGNTIFLIELKHSYFGYTSDKLRKSSLNEWKTAIDQINNIDNPKQFKIHNNDNIVAIALNIITTYSSNFDKSNSIEESVKIYNDKIKQTLGSEKPNFVANWSVHKDMLENYEYINGHECYPYVHIIAKVKEVS